MSKFHLEKQKTSQKPLVLIILDGWGYRESAAHNAIAHAKTPQWHHWWHTHPHMILDASGHAVGLPDAQMGNSEVGHMHMGAGRVILQDLTRINQAIENGQFKNNPVFHHIIERLKKTNHTLHIMGLLSTGGVHSHEEHLFAFLKQCDEQNFHNIALHLFLDGRDTPPQSALESIQRLEQVLTQHPVGQIASIAGRYYAMDRDHRWDRTELVYQQLTNAHANKHTAGTAMDTIHAYYQQGIYDEFIPPTRINQGASIQDHDIIFFFNFRADRARQLTEAFINPTFSKFKRHNIPHIDDFVSMTSYADDLKTTVAFPSVHLSHTLGEMVSRQGLRQLRIAETEKYAHVTFFFNGGIESPFEGEDRVLVASPKVATYDQKPEMSAIELTDKIVEAILARTYDVIICNFANADMVGHTGNFNAAIQAITCLDEAMSRIGKALQTVDGHMLITADHGNAECMYDEQTQQPHTAHTNDPVPLLYVGDPSWTFQQSHGTLIDIAPTMLALLNIPIPPEMTGHVLLHQGPGHAAS